ncbi:uncharacterized protein LOC124365209 [Homalodisca vitripennis]|uniref:uncharacterized protein LOC124365209 n=1 Tax=Homalodisca vitripennis TaxID=197043 RepID=UPI001EEACF1C|nr:uncharacterized protein LOC124365209 [Homalodisca vitripennis]
MSTQNAANDYSDLLDYLSFSQRFCFISLRICAIFFSVFVVIWFVTVVFLLLLLVVFPSKEQVRASMIEFEQRQQQRHSQSPEGGDPMHQSQHDPESPATSQGAKRPSVSIDHLRFSEPMGILSLTFSSLVCYMGVTRVAAIVIDDAELLKISDLVIMFGIVSFLIPTIRKPLRSKDVQYIVCSMFCNIFNIYGIWILWSYYREIRNK